jgi:xanthine dehydrogenase small subunit
LACHSVKDGCSPQGQCGCCTVWVDGAARVACVTAVRRVAGRSVTTTEGLDPATSARWAQAFVSAGASQCGFCTPGLVLRLAALEKSRRPVNRAAIESALLAHLCRCTGWQSVVEAAESALGVTSPAPGHTAPDRTAPGHTAPDRTAPDHTAPDHTAPTTARAPGAKADPLLSSWRAQLEGPMFQSSGESVVLGRGGFADDRAPAGALVSLGVSGPVAPSVPAARRDSGKVQGRNSTVALTHPVPVPEGQWALTLQTTWVEPGYVEPDASWCEPGQLPASPLANGGAFGGKRTSPVRHGPKRPPLSVALRADGTGVLRLGRTPGSLDLAPVVEALGALAPGVEVQLLDVAGPPVSPALRGSGWVELLAALSALETNETNDDRVPGNGTADVAVLSGARARVAIEGVTAGRGRLTAEVWAGEILDPVTLRSYVLGAVHQGLGLVWSEGIAVDPDGQPVDLTIRSFGILAARDMPEVEVVLHQSDRWPVNGSDAVFAATVAAAWIAEGTPPQWPTRRGGSTGSRAVPTSAGREETS